MDRVEDRRAWVEQRVREICDLSDYGATPEIKFTKPRFAKHVSLAVVEIKGHGKDRGWGYSMSRSCTSTQGG